MLHGVKGGLSDVTFVIPSKGENPRYVERIKRSVDCPVIVVYDKGYGEAIKEGIRRATTKYILTLDADGQHTAWEAKKLYQAFKIMNVDLLIGERRMNGNRTFLRSTASMILNVLASIFAGRWVVDLNSGMRIFRRDVAMGYESILCDGFSYTTSLCMSHLADNLRVEWYPITVLGRNEGQSHVRKCRDGFVTLYYIFRIGLALRTRGIRGWLRRIRRR